MNLQLASMSIEQVGHSGNERAEGAPTNFAARLELAARSAAARIDERSYVVRSSQSGTDEPEYEVQTVVMPGFPCVSEAFEPQTMIQVEALASLAWKQTASRPRKRHRQFYRLWHGERITPFVSSQPLPWASRPVLCLPEPGILNTEGYRGRYGAGSSRGRPPTQSARVIVGVTPPYKKLRGVLYGAAQAVKLADSVVMADLKANAALLTGTKDQYFEVLDIYDLNTFQPDTLSCLYLTRLRAVNAIEALRATAHANGGWWPAPETFQVVLKANGQLCARMRFVTGYQPAKRPWIEWSAEI